MAVSAFVSCSTCTLHFVLLLQSINVPSYNLKISVFSTPTCLISFVILSVTVLSVRQVLCEQGVTGGTGVTGGYRCE